MTLTLQERFPEMYTPEGLEMMKSKAPLRNPDGTPANELAAICIQWMKAKQLQVADWCILEDLQEDPVESDDSFDGDPSSVNPTIDDISEILREL
jgi:hypothetical protein